MTTTATTATTTTAARATTTTAATLQVSYAFQRPRVAPPLPVPDDSPRAACEKLMAYSDWLYAFAPDPALVDNAYLRGLDTWTNVRSDIVWLRRTHRRMYDVGGHYRITRVEDHEWGPRLFVTNSIRESRIVNADGSLHEIWHKPRGSRFVVQLTRFGGTWRIDDSTPIGNLPVEKVRP